MRHEISQLDAPNKKDGPVIMRGVVLERLHSCLVFSLAASFRTTSTVFDISSSFRVIHVQQRSHVAPSHPRGPRKICKCPRAPNGLQTDDAQVIASSDPLDVSNNNKTINACLWIFLFGQTNPNCNCILVSFTTSNIVPGSEARERRLVPQEDCPTRTIVRFTK